MDNGVGISSDLIVESYSVLKLEFSRKANHFFAKYTRICFEEGRNFKVMSINF